MKTQKKINMKTRRALRLKPENHEASSKKSQHALQQAQAIIDQVEAWTSLSELEKRRLLQDPHKYDAFMRGAQANRAGLAKISRTETARQWQPRPETRHGWKAS